MAVSLALWMTTASSPGATHLVRAGNYYFNPTNITINASDSILWTNVSLTAHDATDSGGLWTSPTFPFRGTYRFTFTNAGFYPYICALHMSAWPSQTGTVSVVSAEPPPAVILANPRWVDPNFVFSFPTKAGMNYTVERGTALPPAPANWTTVTNFIGNGGEMRVTNRPPPGAAGFYRVQSR